MNTPVEVLETVYPLRIRRYEYRPDSGGVGQFRGGLGLRRDIEVRDHTARFSLLADRHESAPYGLLGGKLGKKGAAYLFEPGTADAESNNRKKLPQKSVRDLESGTVVSIRTPGGGGYGPPADRDSDDIVRDLQREKVSLEFVQMHYDIDLTDFEFPNTDDE